MTCLPQVGSMHAGQIVYPTRKTSISAPIDAGQRPFG